METPNCAKKKKHWFLPVQMTNLKIRSQLQNTLKNASVIKLVKAKELQQPLEQACVGKERPALSWSMR